jgi:hypothetical protein
MGVVTANGQNFAHADITFNIGGVPIVSLSSLEITSAHQAEFSYGAQKEPVGIGIGRNEQVELTFELSMKDWNLVQKSAPNNDFRQLDRFDIPVTFANTEDPTLLNIKDVVITEAGISSDTDNTNIMASITAIAADVEYIF